MKKYLKPIAAVVVLLAVAAAVYFVVQGNGDDSSAQQHFSQLTGEDVSAEAASRPVLGVIIENTPQARPPTGLDAAGIVIEAQTEAGITRYLALYQDDLPEIVGPIRSLRPHFVDWTFGFDASIAHVGGSREALELVDERDVKDLDQFDHSEPYFRDSSRDAPHNMYARVNELYGLVEELGHSQSQFDDIPFSDDAPAEEPAAPNIEINYSSADYRVEYRYDAESNSYSRHLAGDPHVDNATQQQMTVKNVIVVYVGEQQTGVDAIGNGEALVFKNGEVIEARWEKPEPNERIKIVDEEGNEVSLNRGTSWFSILPETRDVNY